MLDKKKTEKTSKISNLSFIYNSNTGSIFWNLKCIVNFYDSSLYVAEYLYKCYTFYLISYRISSNLLKFTFKLLLQCGINYINDKRDLLLIFGVYV